MRLLLPRQDRPSPECAATEASQRAFITMETVAVTQDDKLLWSRVMAGDGVAFSALYLRHSDRVYAHCLQRAASQADAEDMTADVFAAAWRNRTTVRCLDQGGILPWLLVSANNLLKHSFRSLARSRRLVDRIPYEREVEDPTISVDNFREDQHNLMLLSEVLSRLRRADREIIQLCVVQGIAPSVVAELSGENPGSVRSRLSRALERARLNLASISQSELEQRKGV